MDIHGIGVAAAFAAGVVSFLSPCVLPLVPAYVSYIAGVSVDELAGNGQRPRRCSAVFASGLFVLGFSTVFVLLGAGATAAGDFLLRHGDLFLQIAGFVVVVFGAAMTGLFRLPLLQRDFRFHLHVPGGRPGSAYVLGAAFGFGWTPCIGPVLGSILAIAAAGNSVGGGMALLAIYALGLGVPFLAAAAFTGLFLRHRRGMGRFGRRLQVVAGAVLVAMGIAMITGDLPRAAFWLLETFPGLAALG